MKQPTEVFILGQRIKISFSQAKCEDYWRLYEVQIYGYYDYDGMEIVIHDGVPVAKQRETLHHEIMHGAFEYASQAIDEPDEEQFITLGSPIFFAVLRDSRNKDVFNFIYGDVLCSMN